MEKDGRRMTFIVVPHGGRDLNTRSYEISYARLRAGAVVLVVLAFAWLGMALSWAYVASQAARVPGLQRDIAGMETQLAQVEELAAELRSIEGQYSRVREMLGANQP